MSIKERENASLYVMNHIRRFLVYKYRYDLTYDFKLDIDVFHKDYKEYKKFFNMVPVEESEFCSILEAMPDCHVRKSQYTVVFKREKILPKLYTIISVDYPTILWFFRATDYPPGHMIKRHELYKDYMEMCDEQSYPYALKCKQHEFYRYAVILGLIAKVRDGYHYFKFPQYLFVPEDAADLSSIEEYRRSKKAETREEFLQVNISSIIFLLKQAEQVESMEKVKGIILRAVEIGSEQWIEKEIEIDD